MWTWFYRFPLLSHHLNPFFPFCWEDIKYDQNQRFAVNDKTSFHRMGGSFDYLILGDISIGRHPETARRFQSVLKRHPKCPIDWNLYLILLILFNSAAWERSDALPYVAECPDVARLSPLSQGKVFCFLRKRIWWRNFVFEKMLCFNRLLLHVRFYTLTGSNNNKAKE